MIDNIIRFSVKNPLFISLFTLSLVLFGGYSLSKLPVDATPDVTGVQVDIVTVNPSLAALEMERLVTTPIEMAMSNIPGIVEIRSTSKFGLSLVKLVFDDQTDVYWARAQVFERIDIVKSDIPEDLGKPFMGPVSTGLGEIYQYVLRPINPKDSSFSLSYLRELQDWVVRKKLLGTPGVADVSSFGGFKKEFQVQIDLDRMLALGISVEELHEAILQGNSNTGGAYIEKNNRAYTIRGIGLVDAEHAFRDLGNIFIKENQSIPIYVKDVAQVKEGAAIRYGAMSMNGQGEVVGGIVMMMKGGNGSEVSQVVKHRLSEIEKELPEGLMMEAFLDRDVLVSKAIKTVATNLLEGAMIVLLVILVFLWNFRAGLIAASVIPLSMLFAFILMQHFGVVGNLMSLGAIDFGLLVDPAIIVVESVVLYLALSLNNADGEDLDYLQRQDLVIKATGAVKQSVIFGGFIILVVYVPILALQGIEGKMFIPMAKTVIFAISGALILAITYIPMVSAIFLRAPKSKDHHGPSEIVIQFLYEKLYTPILRVLLRHKQIAVVMTLAIMASGVWAFGRIGGEFIPKLAEGDYTMELNLPVGSSLTESLDIAQKVQKRLLEAFPDEIRMVVSKIGTSEIPVDPVPLETQDVVIALHEKKNWTKAKDQWELSAQIDHVLKEFPGVIISIQQPIENRVNDLMSGAKTDVVVKLYGKSIEELVRLAGLINAELRQVEGAVDLQLPKEIGLPQINVTYQKDKLARYGIRVEQVNKVLQTAFAGSFSGMVYAGEKRFDISLRLSEEDRKKVVSIENLPIHDRYGNAIPLREIATIEENLGISQIGRENLQRRLNLGFNVRGRDMESVVHDAMGRISEHVVLPQGYHVEYGGAFENLNRAKSRLGLVMPVALLIIVALLFATFRKIRESLLVYLMLPLSCVGGLFALMARDMNFSISAGVGFVALLGIAVLNGILLLSHFKALRLDYNHLDKMVFVGIKEKFRPILMTSAVAGLGFLPMAFSSNVGAEVQKPLATVVIGGILSATVMTLLILPILYIISFRNRRQINRKSILSYMFRNFILLGFAFGTTGLYAQEHLLGLKSIAKIDSNLFTTIRLEDALQNALTKSPKIRVLERRMQSEKAKMASGFNLENPEVALEATDPDKFKISVSQNLDFPAVYAMQTATQKQRVNLAGAEKKVGQNELIYNIKEGYLNLQFFYEKTTLLQEMATLFSDIVRIQQVQLAVGQISELEKLNAQSQYKKIELTFKEALNQFSSEQIRFSFLIGNASLVRYKPQEKLSKFQDVMDTNFTQEAVDNNPTLAVYNQALKVSRFERRTEYFKLFPGLVLGYLNQGESNSPLLYRFKIGISVPLWAWNHAGRLRSQDRLLQESEAQRDLAQYEISSEYGSSLEFYKQHQGNLQYYENFGLKESSEIIRSAKESYKLGAITYYQYLQNIELAFQIQLGYLETLKEYNAAWLKLQYLSGN